MYTVQIIKSLGAVKKNWYTTHEFVYHPDPATRPRQRETLIELYRKGKIDEALRSFKKIYLEGIHQVIDHLRSLESASASH